MDLIYLVDKNKELQLQRLNRNKPILILDEGTSAIDMQTAYDIENRLLKMEDLTLITITHHLEPNLLDKYDELFICKMAE